MIEIAEITKIESNLAYVKYKKSSDCKSCNSCSHGNKESEFLASNEKNLNFKIGDKVRVYFSPFKTMLSAFIVLIFPLLLFLIFYGFASKLGKSSNETFPVISAVGGLVLGFIISFIISKKVKNKLLPEIMDIYHCN